MRRVLLLLFVANLAWAEPADVVVLGLFKDRAVLNINGKRRVLAANQESPEGVRLISADAEAAVVEIEGRRRRLTLGNQIGAEYTKPTESSVRIWPDGGGMYRTDGFINGQPVSFLVDTGASMIAMGEAQARRLGLAYRLHGEPHRVSTANGVARAYRITLDSVRVGEIQLRNVEASVLLGGGLGDVLLGMSYLGQVEMQREGQALMLRKKY